ncbi:MAG: ASCH domain-containing protein [Nitrospirae bacterium]|nr:ASCH domain-containing protein [Nitrospirota bacterium]
MKAHGKWQRNNFFNSYLGGEEIISLATIETLTKEYPFLYVKKQGNIPNGVAELLARNEIVAWFQGRSEYGPRALGNRSILANPTNAFVREKLNVIKGRENFMPFAPSVLYERASDFFETSFESPYMAAAFKVAKSKSHLIPAVIHSDGTSRVQMIRKEHNEKFYNVISCFDKLSSVPLVLNTSFNGPNEPIVETLKDAIDTFVYLKLDYLAVGDFLIEKKEKAMDAYTISQLNADCYEMPIDRKSFPELKTFLYKKYPFTELIPRDRFQLYSDFVKWLQQGRKTTTIRFKPGGIDVPLQQVMPLWATDSFKPDASEIKIGKVAITHFTVKRFCNLNNNDARRDGFKNLAELTSVLREIYQGVCDSDFVSIYTLELLDSKDA